MLPKRRLKKAKTKYNIDQRKADQSDLARDISDPDWRQIARLIKKYGRHAVVAAVEECPMPNPKGRPSRGSLPAFECIHLAQSFESSVEYHREQGSKHPVRDAEIELFEISHETTAEKAGSAFESWRLTTKKKRLLGARLLKELRDRFERSLEE